jgi:folate-binding protein YgfZ
MYFYLVSNFLVKIPSSFSQVSANEYAIKRYLAGVPEGKDDLFVEKSLPLESNFDHMQGIDFRKGCYLGQELTIRTFHTGVTRKRILPVQLFEGDVEHKFERVDDSVVDRESRLEMPGSQSEIRNEKGKVVGRFGSGVHNIGLALLRLEVVSKGEKLYAENGVVIRAIKPDWWID